MDDDGFILVKKKERTKKNEKQYILTEKQEIQILKNKSVLFSRIKILIHKKFCDDIANYIFSFLTGYEGYIKNQMHKFYNEKYLEIKNTKLNMKNFFHCECCSYKEYCKYYRRISSDKIYIGNNGIELKNKCPGCHCCGYNNNYEQINSNMDYYYYN